MKKIILFMLVLNFIGCNNIQVKDSQNKKSNLTRPNILLILLDDLGYADVGFNGAKDIQTPNLDLLANKGTIFSSAYVLHPFCGPSRAGLLTGKYPHKFGSQFNLPRVGQKSPSSDVGIPLEENFLSENLQSAGYHTGIVGKWHLGTAPAFHPNNRGFDEFYGFLGGGHKYFPQEYKAEYERQATNGIKNIWPYLSPIEYNGKTVENDEYLTDALSHAAIDFVERASEESNPFFLYLSYNAPHVPLEATESDMERFSHIKDEKRQTYAAMVYAVDRGIGEIVSTLKETNQFENTLIVFLSDNGGNTSKGANNFPLKDGKGSTYEGGFRVPMFMHFPQKITAGKTYPYPVSAVDFFPTFCKLAGAEIANSEDLGGINIWENVIKGIEPSRKDMIFALRHRTGYSDVGARMGTWKIVKVKEKEWQLFDVDKDPGEVNDLSDEYPEIVLKMVKEIEQWSESNVQPGWFHDEQTSEEWYEHKMPRFDKTFELE